MTDPPSDKQIAVLNKYHRDIPATKAEATSIIGGLFGEEKEEGDQKEATPDKPEPVKFVGRTESEKTDDAKHMIEILWTMAHTKALEVFPLHGSNESVEGQEEFWHNKDRVILAEVFFKQLSYNWSRP